MHELMADDPDWLLVSEHEDPEAIADPEGAGDFIVTFSDLAAHDYEGLVERTTAVVAAFPGVREAVHEDRELILVWGRDVDRAALRSALIEWWTRELNG
jgi:plasmid stabilization system protein ParE